MTDSRMHSIYCVGKDCHTGNSRPYLADKTLDTGTVRLFLSQSTFYGLGIRLYLTWIAYLIRVDGEELNELPDLL